MPTLTAGQTGTFTLDAFGYIDVVANGDGTLNATSRAPNLKSNVAISRLASVRYGPYGVPMDFSIACTNGAITYTTTAGYGGSSGSGLDETQTISAAGVGASFSSLDASRVSLTFGAPTGTVNAATVQIEDASDSSPLGTVYYPTGSPRWLDIPEGVTSFQLRTTSWSGTGSIPLTVAG